ncbi:hypothetical protein INT43_006591 [Umbelopsis isabellina]|uniref:Calcipressin n=1 Tax=Mortierella isabellina TaxID=91625 RepID=A0A8H7Q1H2_MORIS|nr:hypothetical protein INT43_006591 [Umbelopsis isabellina]
MSAQHDHPVHIVATNTITIPNIPKEFFACPQIFDDLRNCLLVYGQLHTFVAIKGFARIMAVFEATDSAMLAKSELDKTEIGWKCNQDDSSIHLISFGGEDDNQMTLDDGVNLFVLRLYYGQHTNINPDSATVLLQVPELEKNWLISPPGSPPVGWQQIREEPPNSTVLAHDLSHALLSLNDDIGDDFQLDPESANSPSLSSAKSSASGAPSSPVVYVISKEDAHDNEVPQITVQDWDGGVQHHSLDHYRKMHRKIAPTAIPPVSSELPAPSLEDRPSTPIPMSP